VVGADDAASFFGGDGSAVGVAENVVFSIKTSMEPGPTALLGYTGLAELWGRMEMGRWLRETLRGVSQPLPDLMDLLLTQLNGKIARFNQVLIIPVLVVNGPDGEGRYFGGFTNTDEEFQTVEPKFRYIMHPIDTPQVFASGSGRTAAQAPPYVEMIKAHMADPNHSADEHTTLLANINRGVAEADPNGPVSPYCFAMCVGSDTNWVPRMQVFHETGETPPPFHMPLIVCGIDTSNPAEQIHRAAQSRTHPTLDEDQIRRNLDRRP
jgi:hypothetical protein